MNMKRIIFLMILLIAAVRLLAAVWQWSIPVTEWISDETGDHPQAFLWIPEGFERDEPAFGSLLFND
jgi:hypothetical protein